MAESEDIYVKIGERGRLIERTALNPRDHVNFKALGWVPKGGKGAPSKKDETAPKPVKDGLTDVVPTSQRAFADASDTENGTKTRTASGAGSAGARADAASQSAAGA